MGKPSPIDAIKKGVWVNGLFDIKCPDCLKDVCLFSCISSPAINEKFVDPPLPKPAAILGACCGCSCCLLIKYGTDAKKVGGVSAELMPIAVFKAWCCGGCYAHQLMKEKTLTQIAADSVPGVGQMMGNASPSQEEMK